MKNEHPTNDQRKLPLLKGAPYTGLVIGVLAFVCVLALFFFHDSLLNGFIKPRIVKAVNAAYPAYSMHIGNIHYSIFNNRIGFDSVALYANDGTFSGTMRSFSVRRINWTHILWGGSIAINNFASSIVEVQSILLKFPTSHYELQCARLHVSIADSEMSAESVELHPLSGDEEFFRESKFRKTRWDLAVPRCDAIGLACLELLQGKMYRTRSIQIHNPVLSILVNKDKPNIVEAASPLMLNEMLSSIKETLQIDSLHILNGYLKYSESFAIDSKPAVITFDCMQMSAEGITNRGRRDAAIVIHAETVFARAGTMKIVMTIPVASPGASLHYSGSLGGMNLSAINSFLEVSDQMRIKTGILQDVAFEVNVDSGRASGSVRGIYRDLTLAAIDKGTGSEKGFSNRIVSFIANTFKIHGTNVPDKSGLVKIGKVKYTRQKDDSFIQVVWFSLRTGVRDIIGF